MLDFYESNTQIRKSINLILHIWYNIQKDIAEGINMRRRLSLLTVVILVI